MSTDKKNDEIDLIDLFSKVTKKISSITGNFLNIIISYIISIAFFFIRNSIVIIFFVVIGIAISYGYYKITKPYYQTIATIRSNVVSNNQMIRHINSLQRVIGSDNYEGNIEIDNTVKESFLTVGAHWEIDQNGDGIGDYVDYDDDFQPRDTIGRRIEEYFIVRFQVYDNTIIPELRKILVKYVKENPYFQKETNSRKANNEELKAALEEEIKELDSLQVFEYFKEDKSKSVDLGGLLLKSEKNNKKTLYHKDLLGLIRQKQGLTKELQVFSDEIEILQDFSISKVRANNLIYYLKPIVIGFFIFGIILMFIIEKRKAIRVIMDESKK